jgi:hypothetical protein
MKYYFRPCKDHVCAFALSKLGIIWSHVCEDESRIFPMQKACCFNRNFNHPIDGQVLTSIKTFAGPIKVIKISEAKYNLLIGLYGLNNDHNW